MGHRVQSYDESLRASIENAPQFSPTQGAGELGYLDTNSISHWLKGAGGGGRGFVGIGMDIFPSTSGLLQQPGKQMQTLAVESQPVPTEMVTREGVLTAPLHYLAL